MYYKKMKNLLNYILLLKFMKKKTKHSGGSSTIKKALITGVTGQDGSI